MYQPRTAPIAHLASVLLELIQSTGTEGVSTDQPGLEPLLLVVEGVLHDRRRLTRALRIDRKALFGSPEGRSE